MYSTISIFTMIKLRKVRLVGHVARIWREDECIRILVRKSDEKIPVGRTRRRLVDNIKMDHREMIWRDMGWFDLAQDRNE
jgi:hypothetical protein